MFIMKTLTDATKSITKEMNASGILIKDRTVKMILEAYFDYKRTQLSKGEAIEETNVGVITPTFRRSNTFNDRVVPTVKFTSKCVNKIKTDLLVNICKDDNVRLRVAPSMTADEIEYLKGKLGVK